MKKSKRGRPAPNRIFETIRSLGGISAECLEVFDYTDEGVRMWMKDLKGRFLWVSRPWMVSMGIKNNDRRLVIGKTDFDFFSETLASQYQIDDERVQRAGPVLDRVELVGPSEEPVVWCTTTKFPLRNPAGKLIGTMGHTRVLAGKLPTVIDGSPVSPAIAFISRNYSERISNAHLAKLCGLSERAFQRRFNAVYNCAPHAYLRRIRVRLSCNALAFSNRPISEIAQAHGFADQSHFTKEFRRVTGETPRGYRINHRVK